ncbi:chemotaxis protein CheB [Thalassolituus sp. LLYu03]|uniref:chemotaxis protein CheB n=1 Tax=Thalassolituus sp. LLYu03 TaxID=3421656 RepID=UPI003D29A0E8
MGLPRVGILASDRLQQHVLKSALTHFGFEVVVNTSPDRFCDVPRDSLNLDAWLVDLPQDDDEANMAWLDDLLDGEVPVLLGVEKAPQKTSETFPRWEKRLYGKLRDILRVAPVVAEDVSVLDKLGSTDAPAIPLPSVFAGQDYAGSPAAQVWVLGASLGGPGAVKAFLDALPAGLPVAFVYAQHIDPRFEESLCRTIGRHSAYQLKNFRADEPLRCGEVLVAPIQHEFRFTQDGLPQSLGQDWPGPYGPSIDQVILNVAQYYGPRAGYILFSGMGNDGAEAIVTLKDRSVPVWVQKPDTCANSSMPESAIETNRVNYIGDPYQLALQLVNCLKNSWMSKHESISH